MEWGSACNVNWRDAIWSRAYLPAAVRGGFGARWVVLRLVAQRMEPCVLGAAAEPGICQLMGGLGRDRSVSPPCQY